MIEEKISYYENIRTEIQKHIIQYSHIMISKLPLFLKGK